jgi:predicted transcriptional regulator
METRLTIRLPDDLRHRLQEMAASEGVSLTHLIRTRIEAIVADWETAEEAEDIRVLDEAEARLARGEDRLLEWSDVDAELEALPD